MPSDEDFRRLSQQVSELASSLTAAKRRIAELEDFATDHIGLDWGATNVDFNSPHPNISANTIETGGGSIRQDAKGMQVRTGGASFSAIYFVEDFASAPGEVANVAISGNVSDQNEVAILSLRAAYSGLNGPQVHLAGTSGHSSFIIDDAVLVVGSNTESQITANKDDFDLEDRTEDTIFRLSSDASRDITGIVSGPGELESRFLIVLNVGSNNIVLKDESASSTAANRFALNGDITLAPDNSAMLWYDGTSNRWRCMARYT